MKNTKKVLTTFAVAAISALMLPSYAVAVSQPERLEAKDEKGEPFNGKVEAVDPVAKSLTVDRNVILITETSKLTKQGKPITFADIKVGDHVHGKIRKNNEGKSEALNVTVGGEKK